MATSVSIVKKRVNPFYISGDSVIMDEVNTYADLPATANIGDIYLVKTTTGIIGFRKLAGLYVYSGTWDAIPTAMKAVNVYYDNSTSGLSSNNVKLAIDEVDTSKLDSVLTDMYDDIVTNNPYVTGGIPNSDALSITTSSSDNTKKLLQILYMIYKSGIWKYYTSSTSVNSLETQFSQIQTYHENADNLSTGTVADARLSTSVTLEGNTFNGYNQLVKTDSNGKLPAIDGSLLTNLASGGSDYIYNNTFNGSSDVTLVDDSYIIIRFQTLTKQFQYYAKSSASWSWVDGGIIFSAGSDHTVKGDAGDISSSSNMWKYISNDGNHDSQYNFVNYGAQIIGHLVKEGYTSSNPAYVIHAGCGTTSSIWASIRRIGGS